MTGQKILATCDACRVRKVRCLKEREEDDVCINCHRRDETCQFSRMKKRRTQNQSSFQAAANPESILVENPVVVTPGPSETVSSSDIVPTTRTRLAGLNSSSQNETSIPVASLPTRVSPPAGRPGNAASEFFIDRILGGGEDPPAHIQQSIFTTSNGHVASSTIAFFSESKIETISAILGHDKLGKLIKELDELLSQKLRGFSRVPDQPLPTGSPLTKAHISSEDTLASDAYVESFFKYVHPMYPFLDRDEFEQTASRPDIGDFLVKNVTWQALYYAILALGSMYHDGGSFLPGEGLSWKFFQASLNLMPELVLIRRTVETAQALIAMAIFAQTHASLAVDEIPVNEAARIVISLGLGKRPKEPSRFQKRAKAFWVVYCMEKDFSFNVGRSSLISDCDIACPLPYENDGLLGDLKWLRTWASFSRLTSKAYDVLFSVSAALSPRDVILKHTSSILADLEAWKSSVPEPVRPGSPIKLHQFTTPVSLTLIVRMHLYYYNLQIAIARLVLHLTESDQSTQRSQSKLMLMHAARTIVSLTNLLVMEPFTPSWMLTHMPMVAVFILFELAIHNPAHRETATNMTYLDVASGYFARMQMIRGPDTDISISMTNLIRLAKDYVQPSSHLEGHAQSIATPRAGGCSEDVIHVAHDPYEVQQVRSESSYTQLDFQRRSGIYTEAANTHTESLESLVFPLDSGYLYVFNQSFGLDSNDSRFLDFFDPTR